jgi:membrane protein YdbS with pleckstrin-like domain
MTRSKDLDTIAPDDDIITTQPEPEVAPKTIPKKKTSKIKTETPSVAVNEDFNQKVRQILGHTSSPLSSFLVRPKVLKFTEQDDHEKIFLAVRAHWITNAPWFLISVFMLFVPLLFKYFTFLNLFPVQYLSAVFLFWYLLTFIYAFEKFLSWYFDLFLVTSERVIDIECRNLLNKHFAEADLSAIQDVSSSVRGVLGTLFNFGDVLIQTASEVNQITFQDVPNPEKIIKLLKELRDLEEQNKKHE